MLLSAIDGTAGVGKSTLAVHWAHRMRDRFEDGELYVNLRGFDPVAEPMGISEALGVFLAALDVPADRVPAGEDARAALFRSLVHERRMLILLDNARSAEQVRPLLPGCPTCLVLVTSRNRLEDLRVREGASRMTLRVLDPVESRDLLVRYLGRERVDAEPAAADSLVAQCAGLPLALGIVGVSAAEDPDLSLAELVEELNDEAERLDALDAGGETGVRAVFSWSYRSLSAESARLFRLMGLPTGAHLSLDAAAALAGLPRRKARTLLVELSKAHLVDQQDGRYGFHDLLRAYAAECAGADETSEERKAALRRLFDFYLRTSHAADVMPEADITGLSFDDDDEAIRWWERERGNLLAAIKQADALGNHAHAWQLPRSLFYLFHLRGYTEDWLATYDVGIRAARQLKEQVAEAHLLHELGIAHYDMKDFDAAASHAEQAVSLFDAVGDRRGVGEVLIALGHAYMDGGRYTDAVDPLNRALEVARELGNRYGEGLTHGALGLLHSKLKDFEAAFPHFEEALRIDREVGEEIGEGFVLNNRADAYVESGQIEAAVHAYREACGFRRSIGHRQGEAASLRGLGTALRKFGDPEGAREAWQQAVVMFDELGQPEAVEIRTDLAGLESR
ncbi:XRE family transcriptional regulator [Parasphingorhabdus pacifica]